MALRHTEQAQIDFDVAAFTARQAQVRIIALDGVDSNLEEINARCMTIASGLAGVAEGLSELSQAIRDVFDKLEAIDRKIS